jgi:hypothetical protein
VITNGPCEKIISPLIDNFVILKEQNNNFISLINNESRHFYSTLSMFIGFSVLVNLVIFLFIIVIRFDPRSNLAQSLSYEFNELTHELEEQPKFMTQGYHFNEKKNSNDVFWTQTIFF